MLNETLVVLQEVISSSVIIGARTEPSAFLRFRYYEFTGQVLMCTVIRNIGIIWIVRTSSRRESCIRSSAETGLSSKGIKG